MPTTTLPPQRVVLSLPSRGDLGLIILSGFNGRESVCQKATVNLKRSSGYTAGGGLKVTRRSNVAPKSIWTVTALIKDRGMAVRYREMLLLQQDAPYLGQVVLSDQRYQVNARETAWATRSVIPGTTIAVGGLTQAEVAARVFLEHSGDDADIIRPVGMDGWAIDFTATEI